MSSKISIGLALVAILIAIGAWFHGGAQAVSTLVGNITGCGGTTTCLSGDFALTGILGIGGSQGNPAMQMQPAQDAALTTTSQAGLPCALQNPFTATSTFSFGYNLAVGTTTPVSGLNLAMGTTTSATATSTTPFLSAYIPAGGIGTYTFDPSSNNGFIGPLQWITVGYLASSSAPAAGVVTTGTCSATFSTI